MTSKYRRLAIAEVIENNDANAGYIDITTHRENERTIALAETSLVREFWREYLADRLYDSRLEAICARRNVDLSAERVKRTGRDDAKW